MIVAAARLRRLTARVGGLVGHFSIQVSILRIDGGDLVAVCKDVEPRRRDKVALIPVVAWEDVVKLLGLGAGLVLIVILGQKGWRLDCL